MLNRRAILGGALTCPGSLLTIPCTAQPTGALYADPVAADKWMRTWIDASNKRPSTNATKAVNGALHLGRFADPIYFLHQTIGWKPSAEQATSYKAVPVPVGFVTDLASVPRAFWSLLRPDGIYSWAAILHDYLYWEQFVSRAQADEIFRFAMQDFKIEPTVIETLYIAVRAGGASAWTTNAELKAKGERRLLKLFPDDPTTTWAEWKARPGVFG